MFTLALGAMATGGVLAKGGGSTSGGGDVKQASASSAVCTGATSGSAGLNKSGNNVTVNYSASNDLTGGSWNVVVVDNDAQVAAMVSGGVATDWSAMLTYNATKGTHSVVVRATSTVTAETCAASLSFKV